ncbi:hypothetical protein Rsub_05087, partial [Raphidocelis subcapitata]
MSESDGSTTRHSYSTGTSGGGSSAASDTSDAAALNALQDRGDNDESLNDLLDSSRKLDEGVFATLVLLTKSRGQVDLRLVVLRVVFEFLQIFRVVFNTVFPAWNINKSVWAFQAIRWVLIRGLMMPKGYDAYIKLFYALAAIILLSLLLAVWLAVVLKKDDATETGWMGRIISSLQLLCFVVYSLCWVTILDYIVFLLITLIFCGTCLALSIGDCDLNPLTRNVLATPTASVHLKVMICKMAMVILSTCADENQRLQAVGMVLLNTYIWWTLMMGVGYYGEYTLHAWIGLLWGVSYTCILLVISVFKATDDAMRAKLTIYVLYGIFPCVAYGIAVSMLRMWWMKRPLKKLREVFDNSADLTELKGVYRFKDPAQVQMLFRVMRRWDEDGVPEPDATAFGEFILKCGHARFPNNPALLIASANLHIAVRNDGQAARTQLQLAVKSQPSLIERYFIYQTQDQTKRLKDEGGGLDLMGYIEFQRNYRACVRAHKTALSAQRTFWAALLHDTIQFKSLQRSFSIMNTAEARATQVYRKVLERYPTNGRLLKIYGRFLEYCKNDPWTANRYYMEAMKQGTGESLMALVGGNNGREDHEGALQALGSVDERQDGLIIINAAGIIMACNRPALCMFGYEKGELEQKNVSCLMPQPFSGRHNGYLTRYVQTGEARILNTTRYVVGLTKMHSVFPISLSVVKISGARAEAIFMGVVRPTRGDGDGRVRVWVAPGSGLVLTADEAYADLLGIEAAELVGRVASSLGPDIEAIERFLPPIDVEIEVEQGGTDAERILVLNIKCLAPSGALMVVSHKGHIMYATSALASLLGFPAKQLTCMDLQALMPAPYSQLHAGFLKSLSAAPPPTSCRAGAVVHLLRSNGVKVPVTLSIAQHDDGERVQHIVKVLPSNEAARLDSQRLVLAVGESGAVLSVNPGASRALFGFPPQALVGQRLSSFINVFREYARSRRSDDAGLLTALGVRALEGATDEAWRVGVTAPGASEKGAAAASAAAASSLAQALQQRNRERPALMSIAVRTDEHEEGEGGAGAGSGGSAAAAVAATTSGGPSDRGERAALEVVLWRADTVTAVIEVDSNLVVSRADATAGLLFGVSHRALLKKDFRRLAGLPHSTRPSELLLAASGAKAGHHGKKGGLKGGGASKTGVRRKLSCKHADGSELKLEMQAVTKPGSSDHLVLRLQLLEPSAGCLEPLLALQRRGAGAVAAPLLDAGAGEASGSDGGAETEATVAAAAAAVGAPRARGAARLEHDEDGGHDSEDGGGRGGGTRRGSEPPERGGRSSREPRARVAEWVRQAGEGQGGGHHGSSDESFGEEEGARPRGRSPMRGAKGAKSGRAWDPDGATTPRHPKHAGGAGRDRDDDDGEGDREAKDAASASEHSGSEAPSGNDGGLLRAASGVPSLGDASSQQSGSEALDNGSSAAGDGGVDDSELVADFRRAKRLKKLSRLFTCSTAQSATISFRQRTWLLAFIILGAHLAAFAVLVTQIEARYVNAYNTATMARTTDRFQLSSMRINQLQKCALPDFSGYATCSAARIQYYLDRLLLNTKNLRNWHQLLYLGAEGTVKAFGDKRLYDFWTRSPLPEINWEDHGGDDHVLSTRNETLWTMGNKYIMSSWQVHFDATAGVELNDTIAWNYMFENGPDSIFKGYAWSLDTFVDYSWSRLGQLNTVLIVLLVVETLCVQITCMALLTLLVRSANGQHMRRFSVFLALPSATLRAMASRQLVVDDDAGAAEDDEELEALDLGNGGAEGQEDSAKQQKSVRMASDVEDGKEDGDTASPGKKSAKRGGATASKSLAGAALKKPKNLTFRTKVYRALFGWIDTKVKVNGKKLIPNATVVLRFMSPLLLWAIAVVIVFGVSFKQLANLQGPLSSLNAAAHVNYRISRVRLIGNFLGFAESSADNARFRAELLAELGTLRSE